MSQPFPQQTVVVQVAPGGGGLGIASFVVGLVALLFFCLPIVGIPLAGIGLVLGIAALLVAIGRGGRGLGWSIAGLMVNVFALLPILALLGIVGGGLAGGAWEAAEKAARDVKARQQAEKRDAPAVLEQRLSALGTSETNATESSTPPINNQPPTEAATVQEGVPDREPVRTWNSSDGRFSVNARFVKTKGETTVILEKEDGTRINVEKAKLSEADRKVVTDVLLARVKDSVRRMLRGESPPADW